MKSWLQQFIEEQASVEYCPYCMDLRNDKQSCCGEVHFIEFRDLDEETQREIAKEEWDSNFGGK
jgi:hypothetical protein